MEKKQPWKPFHIPPMELHLRKIRKSRAMKVSDFNLDLVPWSKVSVYLFVRYKLIRKAFTLAHAFLYSFPYVYRWRSIRMSVIKQLLELKFTTEHGLAKFDTNTVRYENSAISKGFSSSVTIGIEQ